MEMNIDVIDGRAPANDSFIRATARRLPDEIPVDTVRNMVDQILGRLRGGRIKRLRVYGHGSAGVQGLGDSRRTSVTRDPERTLSVDGDRLLQEQELGRLCGKFLQPGGWVELQGCKVAADSTGGLLLQKLADLWGVPVKAGINDQYVRAGFEGDVVVAWPRRTELEFRSARNSSR